MKKHFAVLAVLATMFAMAGCGPGGMSGTQEAPKPDPGQFLPKNGAAQSTGGPSSTPQTPPATGG